MQPPPNAPKLTCEQLTSGKTNTMTSLAVPYSTKIRDLFPAFATIPTTDITINGCLFHPYIFRSGWKRNKCLFGHCHCGANNAPRNRHSVFVCLRCQRAEYVYAESHKSKKRGLTASQIQMERIRRERRAALGKYMERVYTVRGLIFTS